MLTLVMQSRRKDCRPSNRRHVLGLYGGHEKAPTTELRPATQQHPRRASPQIHPTATIVLQSSPKYVLKNRCRHSILMFLRHRSSLRHVASKRFEIVGVATARAVLSPEHVIAEKPRIMRLDYIRRARRVRHFLHKAGAYAYKLLSHSRTLPCRERTGPWKKIKKFFPPACNQRI